VLVHLPVDASRLTRSEIYFSILARKALAPCHFESLKHLADRVMDFRNHYQQTARPFGWTFTREKLNQFVAALQHDAPPRDSGLNDLA
jgi:hypothetical protein